MSDYLHNCNNSCLDEETLTKKLGFSSHTVQISGFVAEVGRRLPGFRTGELRQQI